MSCNGRCCYLLPSKRKLEPPWTVTRSVETSLSICVERRCGTWSLLIPADTWERPLWKTTLPKALFLIQCFLHIHVYWEWSVTVVKRIHHLFYFQTIQVENTKFYFYIFIKLNERLVPYPTIYCIVMCVSGRACQKTALVVCIFPFGWKPPQVLQWNHEKLADIQPPPDFQLREDCCPWRTEAVGLHGSSPVLEK